MIDVIIPTLAKINITYCISSLKHIPYDFRLHLITKGDSWSKAVNIGLKESENDVLLLDDDVELLEDTLKDFDKYRKQADIIGFKLLYPNGTIQHAGGMIKSGLVDHRGRYQTKGFDEPDIHGTVLFLWGIAIISQILGIGEELGFKEFIT